MYSSVILCTIECTYVYMFVYTFGGVFKKFSMQEFSRDIGVLSFPRAFGRISNLYSDSRI